MFCQLKKEKIKLSVSHPLHAICCCAAVQATCRKEQMPQLWIEERDGWLDCFVLWSYTIWVHCLSKVLLPIAAQILQFLNTSCCLESKKDFCESFDLSSYEQKNTTLIVGYYEQNNVRDKWVLTNAGYFRVDSSLCFKARLSEELLTDNNDFLFSCK